MSRSTISAVVGGMALGAGIAVAVLANAQQPQAPGSPVVQGMPPAMAPVAGASSGTGLVMTGLAGDTFVTVKDQGDAQTVSVFKVDGKGISHLTHKAKFFY